MRHGVGGSTRGFLRHDRTGAGSMLESDCPPGLEQAASHLLWRRWGFCPLAIIRSFELDMLCRPV